MACECNKFIRVFILLLSLWAESSSFKTESKKCFRRGKCVEIPTQPSRFQKIREKKQNLLFATKKSTNKIGLFNSFYSYEKWSYRKTAKNLKTNKTMWKKLLWKNCCAVQLVSVFRYCLSSFSVQVSLQFSILIQCILRKSTSCVFVVVRDKTN